MPGEKNCPVKKHEGTYEFSFMDLSRAIKASTEHQKEYYGMVSPGYTARDIIDFLKIKEKVIHPNNWICVHAYCTERVLFYADSFCPLHQKKIKQMITTYGGECEAKNCEDITLFGLRFCSYHLEVLSKEIKIKSEPDSLLFEEIE